MQSGAPDSKSSVVSASPDKSQKLDSRTFWVLTAYGVSGLALFGVIAYYFSDFVSH